MASINPLTTSSSGSTTGTSATSALTGATNKTGLGKDDFLKLLVGQLQHQDPMNPSSDQDFIGTMAQFSMLEQVTNLAKANEQTRKTLESDHAIGLIGKTVTYKDADGNTVTGVVQKVSVDGDQTKLTVDGKDGIDPSTVTEVK